MDRRRSVLCPLRVPDYWNPARYPRRAAPVVELFRASCAAGVSAVLWRPHRCLRPPAADGSLGRTGLRHPAGESVVVLGLRGEPAHCSYARPGHAAQHDAFLVAVARAAVLSGLAARSMPMQTSAPLTLDLTPP